VQISDTVKNRAPALLAALAISLGASAAMARPTLLANGAPSLDRARTAWSQADFDVAATAYQEALERGGLTRQETVECYSHLGAARYIIGRKVDAAPAFRVAAAIDPQFVVPPEAGKKAMAIAEKERKQTLSLKLDLTSPVKVAANEAFTIGVTVESAQLALVSRIGLLVRDAATSKEYRFEEQPRADVRLHVPASMSASGATLDVSVRALDAHDNELAEQETRVVVGAAFAVAHDDAPQASGGFWHTPWPYLIGTALLAAGGGVGLYFALTPPNTVNVGAPRVQAN